MSRFLGWTVIAVLLTIVHLSGSRVTADDEAKITELLKQRRDVLRELVKIQREHYRAGVATIESVLSAQTELLGAELELCKMSKDRIALREKLIKTAKEFEAIAKALVESGTRAQADLLRATAMRLDAEVTLARERVAAKSKR